MEIIFNNGDNEYFEWMNENPNGFILNTAKGKDDKFFMLHKSQCTHITPYPSLDDKAYTTKKLIKVGSNNVYDLIQYCQKNKNKFQGEVSICSSCKPDYSNDLFYPDELIENKTYIEGAKKLVVVNSYERNIESRKIVLNILVVDVNVAT